MTTQTERRYNGWTNHATWHTAMDLEGTKEHLRDSIQSYDDAFELTIHLADYLCATIEEYMDMEDAGNFVKTRALWWLDNVNWREIAETYVDENPLLIKENWPEHTEA